MIIFIEIVYRFNLNSQATPNIWMKEVLNKSGLNTRTYMRDYKFRTNDGIIFLRPIKGTYWVFYIWIDTTLILTEVHLKLWAEYNIKRNRYYVLSVCKIQASDSSFAAYVLFNIYSMKTTKVDFKSAVLHLFHF